MPGGVELLDINGIGTPQDVAIFLFHLAEDAHPKTRAGERVTPDHLMRQTEFFPDRTHLIFKQLPERLQQFELHIIRQTADIVMALDVMGLAGLSPG